MSDAASYDRDFYAWTQAQAAELRRLRDARINLPIDLDLDHLAEEIEDMGNDTLEKIEGLIVQIIAHLLKLAYCPDPLPRQHWQAETTTWRNTVRRRAKRSKTALSRIDMVELYGDAVSELQSYDDDWMRKLPDKCPFDLEQVLDRTWFPQASSPSATHG